MEKPGTCLVRIAVAAAAIALASSPAASAGPAASAPGAKPPTPGKAPLDTVTVQATRDRKQVEHEVNEFVFAVTVRYLHDSLARWNTPVCPLVAGLPREQGEFVLARLSQIVTAAKAPLGGEKCKANFYIVVTPEPEALIRKWQSRDPRAFNTRNGMGYMRSFRDTPRAVRVWYNTEFVSPEGKPVLSSDALAGALQGSGLDMFMRNVPTNTVGAASRLGYSAVRSLTSVIVVVDEKRVDALSFGQLAGYIGMVGLAEVNQDAEVGDVPTILRLFRPKPDPLPGLSDWDEAFLASLYGVEQASVLEQPMMKRHMVSSLAPAR